MNVPAVTFVSGCRESFQLHLDDVRVRRSLRAANRRRGLRPSMPKHDIADHTEAEDYCREPDGFDEI
jgi:hypothetical protein